MLKKLQPMRLIKRLLAVCYIYDFSWLSSYKYRKKNSDIVIITRHKNRLYDIIGYENAWNNGFANFLTRARRNFNIVRKFGDLKDKTILWSPSKYWEVEGFRNYTAYLVFLAKQLEDQGNIVHPSSYEIQFLENKAFMYQKFKECGVRFPETLILDIGSNVTFDRLEFPCLVKEEHSAGSLGVHKVTSETELNNLVQTKNFRDNNKRLIIQKLLNMRKDLRVTIIGDEIVISYWRINSHKEWFPTATKFGSTVSFKNFPDQWRKYFLNTLKRLNLDMGAFDVAWENDDLDTEPYILEVSPLYLPNPEYKEANYNNNYSKYKNSFRFSRDIVDQMKICAKKYAEYVISKER